MIFFFRVAIISFADFGSPAIMLDDFCESNNLRTHANTIYKHNNKSKAFTTNKVQVGNSIVIATRKLPDVGKALI